MTTTVVLQEGRELFRRQAWGAAYARLSAADAESPLEPDDLEALATAAYLVGRDAECIGAWARAHHEHLRRGDPRRAARCAFWLAFHLLNEGEVVRGGGWLARAHRLLAGAGDDCVEQGYLRWAAAFRCIAEGDCAGASTGFGEAGEIGERFGDADLVALARHGRGRALIRLGEVRAGVALLDEAMVSVEAGELSPLIVGDVYCSVISGCLEVFDLGRAQEWTAALADWCEARPDLVPYRGDCLVRRAELLLLHGAWPDADDAARRAVERAVERAARRPDPATSGAAFYQRAELHRLRGELAEAEQAYLQSSRCGRTPEPGLALLRLAQGDAEAAARASRRAMEAATERRTRSRLLPAHVEIMLAARDVVAASAAADELAAMAASLGAPFLRAAAARARGAVLLATGHPGEAAVLLREAWATWRELDAPYEAARARVLIALACRALGDEDAARLELDAACWAFRQLGAAPELARVDELSRASPAAGGLTAREVQVLRLVATGSTNRAIAAELAISEKTVARHLSNIFTKLGLSSRAAATAFAYERHLV